MLGPSPTARVLECWALVVAGAEVAAASRQEPWGCTRSPTLRPKLSPRRSPLLSPELRVQIGTRALSGALSGAPDAQVRK